MTKIATAQPTMPLKLISLEVLQSGEASPLTPTTPNKLESDLNHKLPLVPGKRSELLVWLENTGSQPIHWLLDVEGSFPGSWCEWTQSVKVIEPHSKIAQTIVFDPPTDFFERNDALNSQGQLQLAYQGSVSIFARLGEAAVLSEEEIIDVVSDPDAPVVSALDTFGGTLVGYKSIDVQIRPGGQYLNLLPEIYRSDFMARFMSIIEQAFDPTVQTTDALWAYLDPLTAPKSMIAFLAQWVDWPLNPNWTLKRQRRLIKHAVELYRWRGTKRGLRLMLHLHTGLPLADENDRPAAIEIKEQFDTGFVLGSAQLGDSPRLGGGRPYFFTVILRPGSEAVRAQLEEAVIRQVIEQEKPAFCSYRLEIR